MTARSPRRPAIDPSRVEHLIAQARQRRAAYLMSALRTLLRHLGDLAPARSPGVEIMRL